MQSADWFVSWWHSDKLRSRLQGREPRRRFASVIILPWPDSHLAFLLLLNLLLLLLLLLFHPLSSRPSHPSPHHTSWAAQSSNSLPCPYPRFEQQSSVPSTSLWELVHDDHVSAWWVSHFRTMKLGIDCVLVQTIYWYHSWFLIYISERLADSHQEDRHKIGQP